MSRRHKAVVILLPIADFERLNDDAIAHDHETYAHAHWLLAERLGLEIPSDLSLARPEHDGGQP